MNFLLSFDIVLGLHTRLILEDFRGLMFKILHGYTILVFTKSVDGNFRAV